MRQAAEAQSLDARQLLAAKDRCGVGWEGALIMKETLLDVPRFALSCAVLCASFLLLLSLLPPVVPCRELSRLSSELDSQQTRACVLLETLETLQVRGMQPMQYCSVCAGWLARLCIFDIGVRGTALCVSLVPDTECSTHAVRCWVLKPTSTWLCGTCCVAGRQLGQ